MESKSFLNLAAFVPKLKLLLATVLFLDLVEENYDWDTL